MNGDFIIDASLEAELLKDWGNPDPQPAADPDPAPVDPEPPQDPAPSADPEPPQDPAPQAGNELLDKLLAAKGMVDRKVYFLNDQGKYEEKLFDDLTEDEKLEVLSTETGSNLTDDELQTINFLRQRGVTLNQYAQAQVSAAIEEFKRTNSQEWVSVNDMTDEELVLNEYKTRYKDALTDEQYQALVDKEKEDEELFKKKAEALRKVMTEEEASYKEMQSKATEEKMKAEYEMYTKALNDAAGETEYIFNTQITDEDRNDAMAYFLDTDENGKSPFYRDMEDPKKQIMIGWLMTHGEEAMNEMIKFIMAESKKQQQPPKKDKPEVVTPPAKNPAPSKTDLSKLEAEQELRALGIIN